MHNFVRLDEKTKMYKKRLTQLLPNDIMQAMKPVTK